MNPYKVTRDEIALAATVSDDEQASRPWWAVRDDRRTDARATSETALTHPTIRGGVPQEV